MTNKLQSTTVYLGNTRTISDEDILEYCSKYGPVLNCSRRLLNPEQKSFVDFTFVRFFNLQSLTKFLQTNSHILNNGIYLDVRPFSEILHPAVPLHVDKKICIENLSSNISLNDIKKYLRTFGTIKQANLETDENEQRFVYIEFESAATRNKLLKGKIKFHKIKDQILDIKPFLRPTDVDLYKMEEQNNSNLINDPNLLIQFEREYNLKIRQEFDFIEKQFSDLIQQKRQNYEYIQKLIE